jgi:hypothetical protein
MMGNSTTIYYTDSQIEKEVLAYEKMNLANGWSIFSLLFIIFMSFLRNWYFKKKTFPAPTKPLDNFVPVNKHGEHCDNCCPNNNQHYPLGRFPCNPPSPPQDWPNGNSVDVKTYVHCDNCCPYIAKHYSSERLPCSLTSLKQDIYFKNGVITM